MIFNQRIGGAGGASASILAYGDALQSTDTVYAEKSGQRIIGAYGTRPNSDYAGLPAAYQQVEYLESTGEQWIDSGLNCNNYTGIELRFQYTSINTFQSQGSLLDLSTGGYMRHHLAVDSGSFNYGYGLQYTTFFSADLNKHDLIIRPDTNTFKLDAIERSFFASSFDLQMNYWLFARSRNGTIGYSNIKNYYCRLYNNGTIVRDLIPCYRVSDHKPGMYDLCGSICPLTGTPFYINSGTGADFLAGAAVPQYKTGFEIAPIREYGTWVLTATHGGSTKTINVLVDAAEEFAVEVTA